MKTKLFLIISLFVVYGCSDIYETASYDEISDENIPLTRSTNESMSIIIGAMVLKYLLQRMKTSCILSQHLIDTKA